MANQASLGRETPQPKVGWGWGWGGAREKPHSRVLTNLASAVGGFQRRPFP